MRKFTKTKTLQSAVSGSANGTVFDTSGLGGVALQVTGTFSATVHFEHSIDGTNYVAVQGSNLNTGALATSATAAGLYYIPVAGNYFRARVAWTSGTSITVVGYLTEIAGGASSSVDAQIGASEVHIGQVGGESIAISQTPTVSAGAYSANDAVGGILTFANAGRVATGSGIIKSMLIIDDAGQDAELELWLFNATFTAMSNNAAWNPSQADLRKLVAIISTGDGAYFDAGTESAARVETSQGYNLAAAGTSLFGQLVTRGTPTYAATDDVTVIIGLLQD